MGRDRGSQAIERIPGAPAGLKCSSPRSSEVARRDLCSQPKEFYREGREVARRSKSNLVFFFAQLRVLRAFAVAHLKMGHGATKRRDLGKSSRGGKKLQDIIEGTQSILFFVDISSNLVFSTRFLRGDA
jgi:hypothetical protein